MAAGGLTPAVAGALLGALALWTLAFLVYCWFPGRHLRRAHRRRPPGAARAAARDRLALPHLQRPRLRRLGRALRLALLLVAQRPALPRHAAARRARGLGRRSPPSAPSAGARPPAFGFGCGGALPVGFLVPSSSWSGPGGAMADAGARGVGRLGGHPPRPESGRPPPGGMLPARAALHAAHLCWRPASCCCRRSLGDPGPDRGALRRRAPGRCSSLNACPVAGERGDLDALGRRLRGARAVASCGRRPPPCRGAPPRERTAARRARLAAGLLAAALAAGCAGSPPPVKHDRAPAAAARRARAAPRAGRSPRCPPRRRPSRRRRRPRRRSPPGPAVPVLLKVGLASDLADADLPLLRGRGGGRVVAPGEQRWSMLVAAAGRAGGGDAERGIYRMQVAALRDERQAQELARRLERQTGAAGARPTSTPASTSTACASAATPTREEAETALRRLAALGVDRRLRGQRRRAASPSRRCALTQGGRDGDRPRPLARRRAPAGGGGVRVEGQALPRPDPRLPQRPRHRST